MVKDDEYDPNKSPEANIARAFFAIAKAIDGASVRLAEAIDKHAEMFCDEDGWSIGHLPGHVHDLHLEVRNVAEAIRGNKDPNR